MDTNEMQMRAALAAKIVAITEAIGKMAKDGQNKEQRYDFISYDALNAKFRELLPAHKLALIPSITSIAEHEIVRPDTGKIFTRSVIQGTMTIVDTETGYAMQCGFAGADNDTAGKSGGKAITEGVKRFELKLFHVSTKDDADPDFTGYPGEDNGGYAPPTGPGPGPGPGPRVGGGNGSPTWQGNQGNGGYPQGGGYR